MLISLQKNSMEVGTWGPHLIAPDLAQFLVYGKGHQMFAEWGRDPASERGSFACFALVAKPALEPSRVECLHYADARETNLIVQNFVLLFFFNFSELCLYKTYAIQWSSLIHRGHILRSLSSYLKSQVTPTPICTAVLQQSTWQPGQLLSH